MHMDRGAWAAELESHDALFAQLAERLPAQLPATRQAIGARMGLAAGG
jgi:phosphoenolpyruvate carboxykinase (GTP)